MALRTFSEIVNDLIVYILRQNQKIDVSPGQAIRDISIDGPASVMEDLYSDIEQVRISQSILNANVMSTQDLDNLVANYGITRQTSSPAQCTVVFYTPVQPLGDFDIPTGTRVGTSTTVNSSQVVFKTLTNVRFIAAFEATYYNPDTGNWEIPASVEAEVGGTNGNVGPYTITDILNLDLPFKVINKISATGGTNQESNQDLATRTVNSFLGNNKGTKNGYLGTVLSQSNVLDALVQGPEDSLMIRDGGQGGKVDIWTLINNLGVTEINSENNSSLSFQWNDYQQSLNGYEFNFPLKPVNVDSLPNITASTEPNDSLTDVQLYEFNNPAPSGIPYIEEGGYHYTFNKANDLDTAHSVNAGDNIVWNPTTLNALQTYPSGINTVNTLQIDITYSYNETIQDLQTLIDDPENKIITADVLVKEAIKVTIDVEADVNLDDDYKATPNTETQTTNNIISAITNYINNFKMGTKLEKSDIIQIAHNVEGVDNVIVSSVKLTRSINPVYGIEPTEIENTTASANEYLSTGTVTIRSL